MTATKSLKSLKSLKSPTMTKTKISTVVFLIVQVISLLVNVLINWVTISWIQKLDRTKCECSEDWKKSGLEYWAYFSTFMSIITFMLNILFYFVYNTQFKHNRYLLGMLSVFSFMNTVGTLLYINNLKSIDCKCSEDMKREILYIFNWIKVAFMIIALIMVIGIMITFGMIYQKKLKS